VWGLIPHWVKTADGGRKPINAKSETISQLPSFESADPQVRLGGQQVMGMVVLVVMPVAVFVVMRVSGMILVMICHGCLRSGSNHLYPVSRNRGPSYRIHRSAASR
jgi:hypothetical protein